MSMITGMIKKQKQLGSMRYIMLVYKYIKEKAYEKDFYWITSMETKYQYVIANLNMISVKAWGL